MRGRQQKTVLAIILMQVMLSRRLADCVLQAQTLKLLMAETLTAERRLEKVLSSNLIRVITSFVI